MSEQETFYDTEVTVKADMRRQKIRDLLLERKLEGRGATVLELANMYNVSPRTIQYDLAKLGTEPDYEPIVLDVWYEWRML